jgi:hypothetical protein
MMALEQLNPRIRSVQIGTKKLYQVQLYPLSFADELSFLDLISIALIQYMSLPPEEQTEIALIHIATEFIKKHINTIIGYVIDEEEWEELVKTRKNKDILSYMDNVQILEVIQAIYEMNFANEVEKKAKELGTALIQLLAKKGISKTETSPPLN